MMKVLFINRFLGRGTIHHKPLGIMSIAAHIQDKHEVFILDPVIEDVDKIIPKIKPDVIAYSIRTGFHQDYINLNKELKKKYKFISVFGGPHATFFPEVINQEGVDCICRGEGEDAFLTFLDVLQNKGDITKVNNFVVKQFGKVYTNKLGPLIQDLDKLKFPSISLFDKYDEIKNAKIMSFITGRGCPFSCSYCFNAGLKKLYQGQKYVRRRSVKNVIDEIEDVKEKYGFEIAIFEDDTFNLDKEWLREFSKSFKQLGLKFACAGVRPDLFDEEMVNLLKEANCISVVIGIESGSEDVRKQVLHRNTSNEQIINCVRLLRKYGIIVITENILGIPNSSLDDDLNTLKLNIACKPNYANTSLMQPYPKTEIYEIAVKQGICRKRVFDRLGSLFDKSNLKINNKNERENLQKIFALIVKFHFLFFSVKWLIKLKLNFLYSLVYNVYKDYYYGLKWMPYKKSIKEYVILFRRYFNLKKLRASSAKEER